MALITWVITNVTSILFPFELSPGFYKIGFALPAHSIFNVLIDIWSGGCNPQLYYALPVLFIYELLGATLSTVGVYRRAHYATIKAETDEKEAKSRIAAAIHQQQEAQLVHRETLEAAQEDETSDTDHEDTGTIQRRGTTNTIPNQEGLVENIRRVMSRPKVEGADDSRISVGPSFALPFKN